MKRNATEDVCASGYRKFRAGLRTLAAINNELAYYGYLADSAPISERTLKHYADLEAHNQATYVPLNRWEYVVRPSLDS